MFLFSVLDQHSLHPFAVLRTGERSLSLYMMHVFFHSYQLTILTHACIYSRTCLDTYSPYNKVVRSMTVYFLQYLCLQ